MPTTARIPETAPSSHGIPPDGAPLRSVRIPGPPPMRLEVPDSWNELSPPQTPDDLGAPGSVLAVLGDCRTLSSAVETNAVVVSTSLPAGSSLQSWQDEVRARQLSAIADVQVLDDRLVLPDDPRFARPAAAAIGGPDETRGGSPDAPGPAWYRMLAATDASGSTILLRHWARMLAGAGVTLTITTVPTVDAAHGALLDAIASSWRKEGTDAAR